MKENFREKKSNCKCYNLKDVNGITLIALVITIIVLLILAGVSLSMVLSQDGIFSRAEQATDKYGQSKARETLELALGEAQMQKYEEGLTEEQLTHKIEEIGEEIPKEDENSNEQQVIVDGYIFFIDRSVPKIIDELGKADDIIITTRVSNNDTDGWVSAAESKAQITGTIKTYSGGTITTVSAKRGNTTIPFSIDKDGKYTIDNITDSGVYTIYAKDSKDKEKTKEIKVTVRVDKTAPTVEAITATGEGNKIKLSAIGHDKGENGEEQSGIDYFNYTITPLDGINPSNGTFKKNETVEITITNWVIYTIKVTATDKCNNTNETGKETTVNMQDTIPPTIDEVNSKMEIVNEKYIIKLNAIGNDKNKNGKEGSGIKEFSYTILPKTGLSESTGTFKLGQTKEITTNIAEDYTISVTAEDNAGNKLTSPSTSIISTGGVIKHIKTTNGLKAVNTREIYGSNVLGYSCPRDNITDSKVNHPEWQIFYIDDEDDNRVYMISKDFVAPPANNATVKLLQGGSSHPKGYAFGTSASDTSILGKYSGTLPNNTTTILGKFINKFLNDYAGINVSARVHLKAMSYMLDQNIWQEYKGERADLTFGGPTLPLFQYSYNEVCRTSKRLDRQRSSAGYKVNIGGGDFDYEISNYDIEKTLRTGHFIGTYTGSARGYWTISPSEAYASTGDRLVKINYDGTITYLAIGPTESYRNTGLRIIVSLKSNTIFRDNGNGSYTITN